MGKIKINSAYSAQPSVANANPFVTRAIEYIKQNRIVNCDTGSVSVADQGCGKLRHLTLLRKSFGNIYLIDTEFQLSRRQRLFCADNTSITEYVDNLKTGKEKLVVMSDHEF